MSSDDPVSQVNPYEILGVARDADFETIRKAYKGMALKHHPDKNNHSETSNRKFQEICTSFDILKDQTKRYYFDKYGTIDEHRISEMQQKEQLQRQRNKRQKRTNATGGYANTGMSAAATFSEFFNFANSFGHSSSSPFGSSTTNSSVKFPSAFGSSTTGFPSADSFFNSSFFDTFNMGTSTNRNRSSTNTSANSNVDASNNNNNNDNYNAKNQRTTRKPAFGTSENQAYKRGPNISHNLKISLVDLYEGKTLKLKMSRSKICETCCGTEATGYMTFCNKCEGTGTITKMDFDSAWQMLQQAYCTKCDGEGKYFHTVSECKTCFGQGYVNERKIFNVEVTKGMKYFEQIVLQSQADEVIALGNGDYQGCIPGNVVITLVPSDESVVLTKNKNIITKEENKCTKCFVISGGKDLLIDNLSASLVDILCGGVITIPSNIHPKRHGILKLQLKPNSLPNPYGIVVFKNLGMPLDPTGDLYGDLYVRFKILFPQNLNMQQQAQLKSVLTSNSNETDKKKKNNNDDNNGKDKTQMEHGTDQHHQKGEEEEEADDDDDVIEEYELYGMSNVINLDEFIEMIKVTE